MRIRVLIVILAVVALFTASLFQPANPLDKVLCRVSIPKGAVTYTVRDILQAKNILKPGNSFVFFSRFLGLSKHMQAGEYEFSPSESLLAILLKLRNGKIISPQQVRVVFPEGTSIYKMGVALEKSGYVYSEEFQGLVKEGITAELRQRYWHIFQYISSESLEGYLYPDTYFLATNTSVADLVEVMISRFDKSVMLFWDKAKNDTQFSLFEIITLASIIEKEAKVPEERAIISSVFHNRLKIKMPLAADPTIKYALERPTPKVYLNQLDVDSLYNTYKRRGLPPGPICNPGIESIKAAVYPARTDYYFFVAKSDGSHLFSRNWQEHQKARAEAATPTQ